MRVVLSWMWESCERSEEDEQEKVISLVIAFLLLISCCLTIIFTVSPPTTNVQTTYENHRIQSPAQKDTKVEEPQDSKIQDRSTRSKKDYRFKSCKVGSVHCYDPMKKNLRASFSVG